MDHPRASIGLAMILCVFGCTRANPDLAGVSKDGTLRVVSAQASHSFGGAPATGVMFVQVDLVLVNHGVAPLPLDVQRFVVQTATGMEYQGAFFTSSAAGACAEGASIADGSAVECVLLFEVPPPGATRSLAYTMPDLSTLSVPLSAQCTDCATPSTQPSTNETCGSAMACAAGSYSLCKAPPCGNRYLTSDGQSFPCESCTDCSAAAAQVAAWCNAGAPPNDAACAAMSDATTCSNCCQTNHPGGGNFWLSLVTACECTNPGACSFECQATLCAGQTTVDATCSSCLQPTLASGGECDVSSSCNTTADCAAYLSCINACP